MPNLVFEIFFIVGVILGGFLLWQLIKGMKAKNWPTVQGKVLDSQVSMHYDDEGDRMYGASVSYSYDVDGLPYSGDKRSFGDYSSNNRRRAENIVAKYVPGADVKVYYRPDDPEDVVLEPGINAVSVLILLLPGIFLVIGALGLLGVLG